MDVMVLPQETSLLYITGFSLAKYFMGVNDIASKCGGIVYVPVIAPPWFFEKAYADEGLKDETTIAGKILADFKSLVSAEFRNKVEILLYVDKNKEAAYENGGVMNWVLSYLIKAGKPDYSTSDKPVQFDKIVAVTEYGWRRVCNKKFCNYFGVNPKSENVVNEVSNYLESEKDVSMMLCSYSAYIAFNHISSFEDFYKYAIKDEELPLNVIYKQGRGNYVFLTALALEKLKVNYLTKNEKVDVQLW